VTQSRPAAVLCPGPSLRETWLGRKRYDQVIAVNEAAAVIHEGWWLFHDAKAFRFSDAASHQLRLVSRASVLNRLAKDPGLAAAIASFRGVYLADLFLPKRMPRDFSAMGASCLAVALGATRIDMYGADWRGSASFDGCERGIRDAERWAIEAAVMQSLFSWLHRRFSVCVRRILPRGWLPEHGCELRVPEEGIPPSDAAFDEAGLRVLSPAVMEAGRVRFEDRADLHPVLAWPSVGYAAYLRAESISASGQAGAAAPALPVGNLVLSTGPGALQLQWSSRDQLR